MRLKINQIALIALTLIAVVLYWQNYQKTFGDKGRLNLSNEGDAVVLGWQTPIEVPMAKRFQEAYANWGDKTDTFIINLNSPGGALLEGRFVIELIERMKKTHLVETRVESGAQCLSMCVPIYLQGEVRTAAADSLWMFHEPSAYNYITGEKAGESDTQKREAGDRFFEKYFANSDMKPEWQERLRLAWKGRDVWFTGAQLVETDSGIIQTIVD